MKRSAKFYRKNEAEVMKLLGLEPTINSGSGWIEKEDGQSEDVICQLKSTDHRSISIKMVDLDTLNYNAAVAHKIPVFAIQFLATDDIYLIVKPEDLADIAGLLKGEKVERSNLEALGINLGTEQKMKRLDKIIESSEKARERFHEEREAKFKKSRKAR